MLFILIQPSALALLLCPGFHAHHLLIAHSDHKSAGLAEGVDNSEVGLGSGEVDFPPVSEGKELSLENIAGNEALVHNKLVNQSLSNVLSGYHSVQFLREGLLVDHQYLHPRLVLSDLQHLAHSLHSLPQELRAEERSQAELVGVGEETAGEEGSGPALLQTDSESSGQGFAVIYNVTGEIHIMEYSLQTNVIVLQPVLVELRVEAEYKPGSRLISFSGLVAQVAHRLALGTQRYSVKYLQVPGRREVLAGCFPFKSPLYLDLNQLRDQAITIRLTRIEARKRIRQRSISQVIQLVSLWKRSYECRSKEGLKPTLSDVARDLGMSRKTLDDYNKHLRIGEQNGFDFAANYNKKMGLLRTFVRSVFDKTKLQEQVSGEKSSDSSDEVLVEWGNSDEEDIFVFRDEQLAQELAHQPTYQPSDELSWELQE